MQEKNLKRSALYAWRRSDSAPLPQSERWDNQIGWGIPSRGVLSEDVQVRRNFSFAMETFTGLNFRLHLTHCCNAGRGPSRHPSMHPLSEPNYPPTSGGAGAHSSCHRVVGGLHPDLVASQTLDRRSRTCKIGPSLSLHAKQWIAVTASSIPLRVCRTRHSHGYILFLTNLFAVLYSFDHYQISKMIK